MYVYPSPRHIKGSLDNFFTVMNLLNTIQTIHNNMYSQDTWHCACIKIARQLQVAPVKSKS